MDTSPVLGDSLFEAAAEVLAGTALPPPVPDVLPALLPVPDVLPAPEEGSSTPLSLPVWPSELPAVLVLTPAEDEDPVGVGVLVTLVPASPTRTVGPDCA